MAAHYGPWWSPLLFWRQRRRIKALPLWLAPVCIGCVAALLAWTADHAFARFTALTGRWWWWPFLSLPLGGMALTLLIRRAGKGAEGSGIQQVVAALRVTDEPERMRGLVALRLAFVKFAAIVGGLGSGFVLGLEGPTVQIGASIFHSFRRFLPVGSAIERRQLILAGGAAGIAAAFNAPLAGLIFAFEELLPVTRGHTPAKLTLAVILAGMVAAPVFGYESYFGRVSLSGDMPLRFIPLLVLLALVGGFTGGLFSWLVIRAASWLPHSLWRLRMRHPYVFVATCGLLIALAGTAAPIFGSGADLTKAVLAGEAQLSWQYVPLKFAGLVLTSLTGLPGGIFSPSLSIGAGLGFYFAQFAGLWQNAFICVGMASVLAGATRAPLTAAFILIEMTDGHAIVLQTLGAAFLAAWAARFFRVRFYHDLAARILHAEAPAAREPALPATDRGDGAPRTR